MTTWINNDGLEINFGRDQAPKSIIGEYCYDGPVHLVELKFDYTQMPTVAAGTSIIDDNWSLPKGAIVEKVEIFTDVDVSSTSNDLTLSLGWIDTDRTSNGTSNSLIDAATVTEINTGGTNVAGWVGASVGGTATTAPKLLTWTVAAHAALTGSVAIRLYYSAH